jgi:hypothetical protein
MSMPDETLRALFAEQLPAEQDDLFVLSVMQQVERRALIRESVELLVPALLVALLLLVVGSDLMTALLPAMDLLWPAVLAGLIFWLAVSGWPAQMLADLLDREESAAL